MKRLLLFALFVLSASAQTILQPGTYSVPPGATIVVPSPSPTPAPTPSPAPGTITIGQTTVLSGTDGGNGGYLIAQNATLSQVATLQSESFYVSTAGGTLILGIYDSTGTNGGPGNLIAAASAFTPVAGWNTVALPAIALAPGTYWLAYLASSNALGFPASQTGSFYAKSGETAAVTPYPISGASSGGTNWSLYVTLSPGGTPTPTPTPTPSPVAGTAPMITLPAGFGLTYNYTPNPSVSAASQIVASNPSTNGSTISYNDPPDISGSGDPPTVCTNVTYQGQPALQVASTAAIGIALDTIDGAGNGYMVSPPFYIEVASYAPSSANGWQIIGWTFPGSPPLSDVYGYEYDFCQFYGNYAGAGVCQNQMSAWMHPGTLNNLSNSTPTGNGPLVAIPASGSWLNAWHKCGLLVTKASTSTPGVATFYVDGNVVWTVASPTDTASVAIWNGPSYGQLGSDSSQEGEATGWDPMSSGSLTAYLGYLRFWAP